MKDKPQMIKTMIDQRFLSQYAKMLIPAVKREFGIEPGIEGSLFSDEYSTDEMFILFLSTDEMAQEIFDFINSKWQFESEPQLIS